MSRVTRQTRRALLAALVLLVVVSRGSSSARDKTPGPMATCVLSNPAYSGVCTQTAPLGPGATAAKACQAVLDCLNNANCLRTYCNATTVRQGWKLESAK